MVASPESVSGCGRSPALAPNGISARLAAVCPRSTASSILPYDYFPKLPGTQRSSLDSACSVGPTKRPMFDLKNAPLDGVGDCLAIGGARYKRPEDQHVQGSLRPLGLERRLASRHGVLSMID